MTILLQFEVFRAHKASDLIRGKVDRRDGFLDLRFNAVCLRLLWCISVVYWLDFFGFGLDFLVVGR